MPQQTDHKRPLVMVVDDEPDMLNMLRLVLNKQLQCDVEMATSGLMALKKMENCRPDVILTDIKMPDIDGLTLLEEIKKQDATISVIIMTGYGTIQMAVQAIKNGAYDFLQKPFEKNHIVRIVSNCLERTRLLRDNEILKEKLSSLAASSSLGFIGNSPALCQSLDLISKIADTDVTVLIRGESGTGKEGAARALHNLSSRRDHKMIIVNCPALPEHILESELFGYVKGAFTDATRDKKGLFLAADHSTILLDEIADIPVSIQTKLLRVLQEKEIQPLGQNRSFKVDVRVVASTNQDLEEKILSGEFREDLFYRLNVVTVTMPSLSEMREDIPLLVHFFLNRYKKEFDKPGLKISDEAQAYLYQRKWRGNVRELQNTVKSAVLLASHDSIDVHDFSPQDETANALIKPGNTENNVPENLTHFPYKLAKEEAVRNFSTTYLTHLLAANNGNVTAAAKESGLERQAFQRLMRRYKILSTHFKNE